MERRVREKKKKRIREEKKRKQSGKKKRKREKTVEKEACIGRPSFFFLLTFPPSETL